METYNNMIIVSQDTHYLFFTSSVVGSGEMTQELLGIFDADRLNLTNANSNILFQASCIVYIYLVEMWGPVVSPCQPLGDRLH